MLSSLAALCVLPAAALPLSSSRSIVRNCVQPPQALTSRDQPTAFRHIGLQKPSWSAAGLFSSRLQQAGEVEAGGCHLACGRIERAENIMALSTMTTQPSTKAQSTPASTISYGLAPTIRER